MKQSLNPPTTSDKKPSWLRRLFSAKPPLHEQEELHEPEVCGVHFDQETKKHVSKDKDHQGVLDLYDAWMTITDGTFSTSRELAVLDLFGITEVQERIMEYNREVCPPYGRNIDSTRYGGKIETIMYHTQTIHLNRQGLDHFGVPIFDFQLLKLEGAVDALQDIKGSISSALEKREGKVSDTKSAYYVFQGFRMLRHLEGLISADIDWRKLSGAFPMVPVPEQLSFDTDLAETEKLEVNAFRTHMNKSFMKARL